MTGARRATVSVCSFVLLAVIARPVDANDDVVLYASDVATIQGNWARVAAGGAAGGSSLTSADRGWSSADVPVANPVDYFEAPFTAAANTTYRVWLRLRAGGDSKWNDSVWVQFSDSLSASGSPAYRVGTTSGMIVNLERCKDCGVNQWGWKDKAYWLSDGLVRFAASGTHTIRVQTREDGVSVDQIVLSPSTYRWTSPGVELADATIVSKATPPGSGPYSGSPIALPGTIRLQDFDNGGEGVAYADTTSGNAGGAYRQTSVDLQASTDGGHNIGWTTGGEWLNYSVNVLAAGVYTATFRVASAGQGGSFHLEMNGINVTGPLTAPNTGGWQNWTSVSKTVTLSAGSQVARLVMDSVGTSGSVANFNSIQVSGAAPSSTDGGSSPYGSIVTLPGTVQAENFDNGGQGVAYHDTSSTNAGGAYRQTAVDIEASTEGGYNVGWIAAGEWLKYTVNVGSSGSHTVQLRVASVGGGSIRVGFNGSSTVSQSISVPDTGGWQNWSTVSLPVTLGSGQQTLTVYFETSNINFNYVEVVAGTAAPTPTPTPTPTPSPSGSEISVVSWNVQNNDFSDGAARDEMARAIAISPRPQVIAIQEAWIQFFNSYKDELQRRTGQTWYGAFQTMCPSGGWNGSSCTASYDQGIAIFSAFPIQNTSAIYLPFADCWNSARAALRAAINVNGKIVQIFNTHLQTGCGDVLDSRYRSMAMIKDWARNFSTPQIVAGDFNADPDQILSTSGMAPNFLDSWPYAGSGSRNTYPASGPLMKLDYLLFDASWGAHPVSSKTVYLWGSDHLAVQTTFQIK